MSAATFANRKAIVRWLAAEWAINERDAARALTLMLERNLISICATGAGLVVAIKGAA
ncbi:hypothetical protein ACTSKR_07600 [Chitinibacteraceae bacterium HSL-7]